MGKDSNSLGSWAYFYKFLFVPYGVRILDCLRWLHRVMHVTVLIGWHGESDFACIVNCIISILCVWVYRSENWLDACNRVCRWCMSNTDPFYCYFKYFVCYVETLTTIVYRLTCSKWLLPSSYVRRYIWTMTVEGVIGYCTCVSNACSGRIAATALFSNARYSN